MKTFPDYKPALAAAIELARSVNRECGIEKAREFGRTVYRVKMLPNPENRTGWELTCEVVRPTDPMPAPVSPARKPHTVTNPATGNTLELVGEWKPGCNSPLALYWRDAAAKCYYVSKPPAAGFSNIGSRIRNSRGQTFDGAEITTLPDLDPEATAAFMASLT